MDQIAHPPVAAPEALTAAVRSSIDRFRVWLGGNGFTSYDQYDFWSTRAGRAARRTYYRNHLAGAPLVGPVFLLDILAPGARRWVVPRRRFPIADAHFVLGFVRLARATGDEAHLRTAERIGGELLRQSIPGFAGHCWGYPFDWETSGGLFTSGVPLITTTPYCFEAFLALHDATGAGAHLEVAASSARFADADLHDTAVSDRASACSYSPIDRSQVMNANAYRAFMLAEASRRFGERRYRDKAERNLQFVLDNQRADGSWLYAAGSAHNAFVDNFHTAFVLKNLAKANAVLGREDVAAAIRRGYAFYRRRLHGPDGLPLPFAEVARTQPVRLEAYDLAEGIALGALLRDHIPGALEHAGQLAQAVAARFQLADGHFLTRISVGGLRNTVPYLRWPQAQMFHALAFLYETLRHGGDDVRHRG